MDLREFAECTVAPTVETVTILEQEEVRAGTCQTLFFVLTAGSGSPASVDQWEDLQNMQSVEVCPDAHIGPNWRVSRRRTSLIAKSRTYTRDRQHPQYRTKGLTSVQRSCRYLESRARRSPLNQRGQKQATHQKIESRESEDQRGELCHGLSRSTNCH